MTKQHIEQIFKDSIGYVPVDIKFTDNSREVALGMIRGKARMLYVGRKAHFDDVCDALEAGYDSLRVAA